VLRANHPQFEVFPPTGDARANTVGKNSVAMFYVFFLIANTRQRKYIYFVCLILKNRGGIINAKYKPIH